MRIDGHGHACGGYLTIEDIHNTLSNNNFDAVVLVPGELNNSNTYKFKDDNAEKIPQKDVLVTINKKIKIATTLTLMKRVIPKGNEYVFQLKKTDPDKIKQFFWLTKKQWFDIDYLYTRMQFEGIKLHQCWEYFKVDSDWFKEVTDWCVNKNLPIFIHFYSHKEIKNLISHIKNNKEIKVIIGHLFGVEYFLNEELKYFNNIFFDLSNTYFVSEYRLRIALKHFGSSKLLLGSDTPYGENALEKCIKRIEFLDIKESDKENILSNNMNNILRCI